MTETVDEKKAHQAKAQWAQCQASIKFTLCYSQRCRATLQ